MNPAIKPNYQTTFHRDGTVSFWSVYERQWTRQRADSMSDKDLASMRPEDRQRIARLTVYAA